MIHFVSTVENPAVVPEEKINTGDPVKKEVILYNAAIKYLYAKTGDRAVVHYYLNLYKYRRATDMKDLYYQLLKHAKDRHGTPLAIDDIKEYRELTCEFDPAGVVAKYVKWEEVFEAVKKVSSSISECDKSSRKNYWALYSRTIFSAARFLARFPSLTDFNDYALSFVQGNNDKRIAFSLLLSQEIDGFGFMMACDFLKEWVSPFFVKPNTYIKEIFLKTHFCSRNDTDFDIYRKLLQFSETVGQTPYVVDRVFWLIGSGKLFKTEDRKNEIKITTSKEEFIADYLNRRPEIGQNLYQ